MHRLLLRLGALGALLMVASPSGVHAQAAPDPRVLLEETAARYQTLGAYQLRGTVSVEIEAATGPQSMALQVLMAEDDRGGLRAEVSGADMEMVLVTARDTSWMYLPALNQYVSRPGRLPLGGPDSPVPDLLGDFRTLADSVAEVTLVGEEPVRVGETERPAYVVDVVYHPRETPIGVDSTRKRLWIDRSWRLVLRDETDARTSGPPGGGPMRVRETTAFDLVRLGEGVPASLFTFMPPPGATRIDPAALRQEPPLPRGEQAGSAAPPFRLRDLQGRFVQLSDFAGQTVVVNFWATWCGPCRYEMPILDALYQRFRDDGLVVLAVDLGEPALDVRTYLRDTGYTFPVLLDFDGSVAAAYGAASVPSTYIIDGEGTITHHLVGAQPEANLRRALREAGFE